MKKLTAVMAVGAVAACAYASAENTVTLKRDVLGRALGTNQKQPVLLKNTTVQKTAEPLAATSTSKTYASMKNVFADNPFNDANDNIESVYGAFVSKGMKGRPGYSEKYYLYDKGNEVTKSNYQSQVDAIEKRYRTYARNYVAPKVAIPSSFESNFTSDKLTIKPSTTAPYSGEYFTQNYAYYLNMEDAFAEDGVGMHAHNNNATGYQSNIFAYDIGRHLNGGSNVVAGSYCSASSSRYSLDRINTTRHASVASHVAPDAKVYMYDLACSEDMGIFPKLPTEPENYNMTVGLMNASSYKHNTGDVSYYGEESAILDDYIYYNRVAGVAPMQYTGNNNYADALNAITVGSTNPYLKRINFFAQMENPSFFSRGAAYVKPEISNYGYLYMDGDYTFTTYNGTTKYVAYPPAAYGSSVAAAYTAGVISDLISLNSFYKWHPEVVKALLLTTSSELEYSADYQYQKDCRVSNSADYIGNTQPMFDQIVTNNRSRYWMGKNNSHFNSNNEIEFTETNITKGRRYRIAIAWLMRGDHMISNNTVSQDIDLSVYVKDENGVERSRPISSSSTFNGYEMVDFVAPSDKDIRIVIKRYSNRGGRVLLGYNLHESWD